MWMKPALAARVSMTFDPMKLLGERNTGRPSIRVRSKRRGSGRMRRNIDSYTRLTGSTLEQSPNENFTTGFLIFRGSFSERRLRRSIKRKY